MMVRFPLVLVSAVLAFMALPSAAQDAAEVQEFYDSVNEIRAEAHLPPLEPDRVLARGCQDAARYMVANAGTAAMRDLAPHTQQRGLAGYTDAGARCAANAVLHPKVADLRAALASWMGGLYHRRSILSPATSSMAVGTSRFPDGQIAVALMLPEKNFQAAGWPILWPVDGQTDVPLDFAMEVPNPIPNNGAGGGYPITLYFPAQRLVGIAAASLRANGQNVPVHLASPARPATDFSRYGVVSMIPKEPLLPGTTYTLSITTELDGIRTTTGGSFTTVELAETTPDELAASDEALGVASRIVGTVSHAGTMAGGAVFLQLANAAGYLISVMIPASVWPQIGGGASPLAWKGRELQVDATPARSGPKAINLPVGSARQLRVAGDR